MSTLILDDIEYQKRMRLMFDDYVNQTIWKAIQDQKQNPQLWSNV